MLAETRFEQPGGNGRIARTVAQQLKTVRVTLKAPSRADRGLPDVALGGFLNRKGDGFPGPQTLWIELQRAADFVLALEIQRSIAAEGGG